MSYEYKMLQIPPRIQVKIKVALGNEAADYLETIVNKWSSENWEFYRVDTIGVVTTPGCLASLFGAKAVNLDYYVITLRRALINVQSVSNNP